MQSIPYTKKNVEVFQENILHILDIFENNVLIENVTQHRLYEHSEMTESEFIAELIKKVDNERVKLLLDVTNMFITAKNNNIDFFEYCKGYPLDKIECIHLSGYEVDGNGIYQDTHSSPLSSEILKLAEYFLQHSCPKYLLIERDFNIDSIDEIIEDLNKIKGLTEQKFNMSF